MSASFACVDAFVGSLARQPVEALIGNLSTRVERLDIAGCAFPVTVNDGGLPGNCYICNPVAGYTDYAVEETRNFVTRPALRRALTSLIRAAAPLVRATGLDRAVHVNNWLFSTNPAPPVDRPMAAVMRDTLVARFPAHAIILRSLNTLADRAAIQALRAEGFALLPSRQVYLFDARAPVRPSKDMKHDRALLRKMPFGEVGNSGFSEQDYDRCAELYRLLYLDKYTPLNPQYNAEFIATLHRCGVIRLEGLRGEDGQLVAMGGRFRYGRTLTQPLLGYDTARPRKDGLYRLVTAMAQRDAMEEGLLFNMSAGAAGFKRHRGAVPAIEYSAVYVRHLPLRQRTAIRAIGGLLSRIGVPLLRRFEL